MRLVIDRDACMKSGQCTYLHPELLADGPDGYPRPVLERLSPDHREAAQELVELCPAEAIALEED